MSAGKVKLMRKRIFIYGILILAAAGVFWGRPYIENFYLLSKAKIQDLAAGGASLEEAAQKSISAPPPLRAEKESPRAFLTQKGVIGLTNVERHDNGQKPLGENTELDAAAFKKAQDILARQYFDHVNPDGHGPDWFVSSAGYEYVTIGENLALGNFADDRELVDAWMASPGHRENILRPQFREIGVAVVKGIYEGRPTWVAVQEFGAPLSVCPAADESLKKEISANMDEIETLGARLKEERARLKDMGPRSDAYGQAVDDFNALVEKYNSLVSDTKGLVEKYNNQVNRYNACVKSF